MPFRLCGQRAASKFFTKSLFVPSRKAHLTSSRFAASYSNSVQSSQRSSKAKGHPPLRNLAGGGTVSRRKDSLDITDDCKLQPGRIPAQPASSTQKSKSLARREWSNFLVQFRRIHRSCISVFSLGPASNPMHKQLHDFFHQH